MDSFLYAKFVALHDVTYICYISVQLGKKMNLKNMKIPNVPGGGASSALLKLGLLGGIGLYAAANSLYNVEGGHRAIVFNRLVGVKDKVII